MNYHQTDRLKIAVRCCCQSKSVTNDFSQQQDWAQALDHWL